MGYMRKLLVLFSVLVCATSQAQDGRSSVYLQLFGITGTPTGIGYDYVLGFNNSGYFTLTTGLGFFPQTNTSPTFLGIPVMVNAVLGNGASHFEVGLGLTYNSGAGTEVYQFYNRPTIFNVQSGLYGAFRMGYRLHKPQGFFFRASFSPLVLISSTGDATNEEVFLLPEFAFGASF